MSSESSITVKEKREERLWLDKMSRETYTKGYYEHSESTNLKGVREMTKIRAEIDVIDGKYCENENSACPMYQEGYGGRYYCSLFESYLDMDKKNHWYCKRCKKCKQAELKE